MNFPNRIVAASRIKRYAEGMNINDVARAFNALCPMSNYHGFSSKRELIECFASGLERKPIELHKIELELAEERVRTAQYKLRRAEQLLAKAKQRKESK